MADSYTDSLRAVQQVNGENDGTWGDNIDLAIQILEDSIADVRSITQSSTSITLSTNNNADDQARAAVLDFTGSPTAECTVTVPDKDKVYIVYNGTDETLTFTKGSAITYSVRAGDRAVLYVKGGTGIFPVSSQSLPGKNLVINGDMQIAKRGASFTTVILSQYTLDRWEWIDTGTTAGVVTITQDTDVPSFAEAGVNFENSIKIDCTTAEDLASADAALYLSHKIEAQDCTLFGHGSADAVAARLSFWMKSTKTGIFSVNLDRNDASEKYTTEFTAAAAWTKFEVTIPGDTGGTAIADDNGIGLAIQIMLSVGGDGDTSTADAWNANGATELATSNQVNLLDNSANNVFITGVKLEVGEATTPFVIDDMVTTQAKCNRYYQRWDFIAAATDFVGGYSPADTSAIFERFPRS